MAKLIESFAVDDFIADSAVLFGLAVFSASGLFRGRPCTGSVVAGGLDGLGLRLVAARTLAGVSLYTVFGAGSRLSDSAIIPVVAKLIESFGVDDFIADSAALFGLAVFGAGGLFRGLPCAGSVGSFGDGSAGLDGRTAVLADGIAGVAFFCAGGVLLVYDLGARMIMGDGSGAILFQVGIRIQCGVRTDRAGGDLSLFAADGHTTIAHGCVFTITDAGTTAIFTADRAGVINWSSVRIELADDSVDELHKTAYGAGQGAFTVADAGAAIVAALHFFYCGIVNGHIAVTAIVIIAAAAADAGTALVYGR